MKRVLHLASSSRAQSNRLDLQCRYAEPELDVAVLNLRTELPGLPGLDETEAWPLRRAKSALRLLFDRAALAWRLFRDRADVLHAHENASLWGLWYWTRVLRRPAVWDPHDFFHERLRRRAGRDNLPERIERRVLRNSTPVFAVSDGMAARYRELYPRADVTVLYNYSTVRGPSRAVGRPFAGPLRIVYPGLVKPERIEPELVRAVAMLRNVRLDIIGGSVDEPYVRELAALIERERIANVSLVGRFTSANVIDMISGYHYALFPFPVTYSNLTFCLPNKFYQCVAAGLPMIMTDMEEMAAIIRRYCLGHVFPSRDYATFAQVLGSLDPADPAYRRLVDNVRRYGDEHVDYDAQRLLLLDRYTAAIEGVRR